MEERQGAVVRVLTLLEVLQPRGRVAGPVLASRLGVDQRTLRRDVARLQKLGIPVEAGRGRHGGYQLQPGFRLPPLMLTEEEAVAVVLGLRAGRQLGVVAPPLALEGALAKLSRALPVRLRDQVRALEESVGFLAEPITGTAPVAEAVFTISGAASRRHLAWVRYRDARRRQTERTLEPYGLAVHEGRWYLSARDAGSGAVRVFRLDRVLEVRELDGAFERPAEFDSAAHVRRTLAAIPWGWEVEVLLDLPAADARRRVPSTLASVEETAEGTLLRTSAARLDAMARFLVGLQCGFRVVRPAELREELRLLGQELLVLADA